MKTPLDASISTQVSCGSIIIQLGHYFNSKGTGGIKGDGNPWYKTPDNYIAPTGTGYETADEGTREADFLSGQGYGYDATVGKVTAIYDTIKAIDGDNAHVVLRRSTRRLKLTITFHVHN